MHYNHDNEYKELKNKVSRLYDELDELVNEVEKKDDYIEQVQVENNNLRSDL